jgi:hypothetical protein
VIARSTDAAAAWLLATLRDPPERDGARDHADHGDHDHGVGHGVDSAAVPIAGSLDLEVFEDEIAALPPAYFRVKAIVHGVDPRRGDRTHGWAAVHRVGGRVSSEPVGAPVGGARIVGLGSGVTAAPLAACAAAAVLPCDRGTR